MTNLAGAAKRQFDPQRAHRAFVAVSLALAIFGGLTIATAIAIDAAQGFSFGARWFALAQAHGHLQSVGFVGLFVIGVSFRLVPRFAGRPAPSSLIVAATLLLVALGVIARAIGQPLSDKAGFDWLMATGGWLELGGALLFAAVILRTLAPALRGTQGWALFFALGAIGFAVQAALGAWWLEDAVLDDRTLISSSRDQLLLSLQFFAIHLPFVLGVGLRAWPTFFGRGAAPFPAALVVALALLLANLGLVVAHFIGSSSGTREWELEDASIVLLSAGLIGGVLLTRTWGSPLRLRPATRSLGRLLQLAMFWLVLAAGLYGFFAIRALIDERGITPAEFDSVRHLIGIGVLMLLIVTMAHIVLPEFATERLSAGSRARRIWAFGALLSIAALTRASPGFVDSGASSRGDYWHMAAAGILTLATLCWFAWLFIRAIHRQPQLLQVVEDRIQHATAD